MRRLAEEGIPLTVCPLYNVSLKVSPDIASLNLKRLMDAGVHVTINSDDPPYLGGYVNDNFRACADALGLDRQHFARLAHNNFTAASIDEPRRTDYISELDEYVRTNLTKFSRRPLATAYPSLALA
jgi:adenosine deaminase